MSAVGMDVVPQVCDLMVVVVLALLLKCWTAAVVDDRFWMGCRLVWQWHY